MHGSMRRREATHGQSASPCGPEASRRPYTRAAATSRTVDAPLAKDYSRRMRQRALVLVGTFWIGAALIGHAKERRGAVTCECQDDCWCKKPGVDLFRWVLPIGHRLR